MVASLKGVNQIGWVVAHKITHHKWPNQVPIIDSLTVQHLPTGANYEQIHKDLVRHAPEFQALEQFVAPHAVRFQEAKSLTRLRIHDILLWLEVKGHRSQAIASGDDYLTNGVTWAV
jgi:hypothetical protein